MFTVITSGKRKEAQSYAVRFASHKDFAYPHRPRPMTLSMVGRTLNHYIIDAKLGSGGMGDVYRATDTNLSRDVAIKVLSRAFAQDAGTSAALPAGSAASRFTQSSERCDCVRP
jgi:serine/threonine protein kinase